jgi:hypothetical protein
VDASAVDRENVHFSPDGNPSIHPALEYENEDEKTLLKKARIRTFAVQTK